ncbi:type II secretion system ATPase GspE [Kangiella shandongensis]|uniref:type II secretion system ATPase GspE n=1 Tax=Kangiella shandongensis TaxID=2763258 RepID=UPI002E2D70AE|nr:type II secretion system ATPase GspE [Kangiella shandongensis]
MSEPVDNNTALEPELEPTAEAGRFRAMPFSFAKRHGVFLTETSDGVKCFMREGASPQALLEVRRHYPQPFNLEWLDEEAFEKQLSAYYQSGTTDARQTMEDLGDEMDLFRLAEELPETEDLLEAEDDAPIIKLINALLTEAIKENASDIHIETFEKTLSVRFRIDGVLREVLQPSRKLAPLLVSRIKVMGKLDIAEKRIPQDGRIALRIANRAVDVRVSTMPSSFGERVVLRLLDKEAGRLDFQHLGMQSETMTLMHDILHKPHGIILVTGPTGSGKTTTLYAGLSLLNNASRNILTVEDPIEYLIDGIGQTQVNPKVDMTFARGLRAILRQDPDVVMIGEIRDLETAQIAVQASLTGHLVLSTLHTNTAIGAVTRMQDMGVEPFLLSSSLLGVLAQRLVRMLCNECKESAIANEKECELMGFDPQEPPTIYHPVGCDHCNQQGFRGRQGIYELVLIDDQMRTMIHNNNSEQEMERHARQSTPSIRADGRRRVLQGITTVEEVLRVTRED